MNKLVTVVVSLYVAVLLYIEVPFVKSLSVLNKTTDLLFWNHIGILVVFFALAFLVLSRYISAYEGRGAMGHLKLLLVSIALIGLVVAILYHVIPLKPIYDLPAYIDKFFASDFSFSLWLLAPLAILFI